MKEITYTAFFDELEKIAREDTPENKFMNKDRFKRMLQIAGVSALGSGLGYATGTAIGRSLGNSKGSVAKAIPILMGLGGLVTPFATGMHRQKADRYVETGKM